MRTVELDEDVYSHLLQNVSRIGESASSILRRLLAMPASEDAADIPPVRTPAPVPGPGDPLLAQLESDSFRYLSNATDRYLQILGFAYARDPESFPKLLGIGGRTRKYFAATRTEVANSGRTTHPREIPGSPYWALTNTDTGQKKDILRQALERLGYPAPTVRAASAAVR